MNTALWAYYEYDAPLDALQNAPQMKFLCDITIGEGESVAPNTKFIKTWRIKNIGNRIEILRIIDFEKKKKIFIYFN